MIIAMKSVKDLIALWPAPSMSTFARDCDVEWMTAHQWRRRGSIPPEYWSQLVNVAKARRIKGVSIDALAALRARKREAA
jgi:hypothetical protein